MQRLEYLRAVLEWRAAFDAAVQEVHPDQMLQPGVSGTMSVKDILAHVAWFEREMVGLLRERALAGSDLWNRPQDERNAAILAAYRDRPLDQVLRDSAESWQAFARALEALDEEALNDPACFRDMPPDWTPWDLIAGNSWEHYRDHAADIRAWLEQQEGPVPD